MKTEIAKISQDLEQGTIAEQEARILLLDLLNARDNYNSINEEKGIEICQRGEQHLYHNEEDTGHIPSQLNIVKESLSKN